MNKGKKSWVLILLAVALTLSMSGSAYAFSDIQGDAHASSILKLKDRGIVKGEGKDRFNPKGSMSNASAISLIVNALELSLAHIQFIKAPEASDYFTKVKNDAWYAESFIIAHHNGLELPRDINPSASVTREQFAKWLWQAIDARGDYALIELYVLLADEDRVSDGYMDAIQKLLITKIASLDGKNRFRPQQPITRAEAAGMVWKAIEFVENTPSIEPLPENPETGVLDDVQLTTETIASGIVKATVSAKAPHPGYGIEVSGIDFVQGEAIVRYRLILPDPAALYPQVVTDVKASAYIDAKYKAVLGSQDPAEPFGGADDSVSSDAAQ